MRIWLERHHARCRYMFHSRGISRNFSQILFFFFLMCTVVLVFLHLLVPTVRSISSQSISNRFRVETFNKIDYCTSSHCLLLTFVIIKLSKCNPTLWVTSHFQTVSYSWGKHREIPLENPTQSTCDVRLCRRFIFQQGSDPQHTAKYSMEFSKNKTVKVLNNCASVQTQVMMENLSTDLKMAYEILRLQPDSV